MAKKLRIAAALAAAFGLASAFSGVANAQSGVAAGTLTCNVASGWGFVFGSSRGLNCTYAAPGGRYEYYTGSITKFGVDIGYAQGGVLIWTVIAPGANVGPGALAGNYAGASASATVGIGVGANGLVGGSGNSFSLQPLSLEANRGLNVAAGISGITLTAAR